MSKSLNDLTTVQAVRCEVFTHMARRFENEDTDKLLGELHDITDAIMNGRKPAEVKPDKLEEIADARPPRELVYEGWALVLPDWANYVAADNDGKVAVFDNKPTWKGALGKYFLTNYKDKFQFVQGVQLPMRSNKALPYPVIRADGTMAY